MFGRLQGFICYACTACRRAYVRVCFYRLTAGACERAHAGFFAMTKAYAYLVMARLI